MGIFKTNLSVEELNKWASNTLAEQIGIEITSIGDDYVEAKMPVDRRTHQPIGLLHGGASVALAETIGSISAMLCLDASKQYCVGLEINANHIKAVKSGFVIGRTKPIHIGKWTQVWEIKITLPEGDLVCVSRITMAVLDKRD